LLYNNAYRAILKDRDAWALGKSVAEVWHDLPAFRENFGIIDATGKPVFGEDALFFIEQPDGRFEELWSSWALIPLPGATGNIGYYNAASLSTSIILYERRMSTLLALERHTASVNTTLEYWTKIMHGLEANSADVPFAAVYSAETTVERASGEPDQVTLDSDNSSYGDASSSISGDISLTQWTLRGVLEAAPAQLQLPETMNIETAMETFGPLFKTAVETRQPQRLQLSNGTFPKSLQSRAVSRAYGDLCHDAILIPISRGPRRDTAACLLLGLNSRARYDEDYKRFVSMLRHQLAMSMKSVTMAEDDARHLEMSAALAARDRLQLAEKLDLSQQDAKAKELRFRSMADHLPISMFEVTPQGQLLYVNDSWYELTGFPRNDFVPLSWFSICHPDDSDLFAAQWSRLS
jgi:PAS domain-containing protein